MTADRDRIAKDLEAACAEIERDLAPECRDILDGWQEKKARYRAPVYTYQVRGRDVSVETHSESLSHTQVPKISLPRYEAWGEVLRWNLSENVPGEFPYTARHLSVQAHGGGPHAHVCR